MLFKSFTVPSALLTRFPKKFHTKLLGPAFVWKKLSTKTLCSDGAMFTLYAHNDVMMIPSSSVFNVSFELVTTAIAKICLHHSYWFLSMFTLPSKRHCRNLATYSLRTTRHEHVTKTAPARRRHAVGGGAPIRYDRRRRRQLIVSGGGGGAQL